MLAKPCPKCQPKQIVGEGLAPSLLPCLCAGPPMSWHRTVVHDERREGTEALPYSLEAA